MNAASIINKHPCVQCEKGTGIASCGGCQQWFCIQHFNMHRQQLTTQMDNIAQEHDLLQGDLMQSNATHDLFSYVDDWEKKSITKIQEAAERARTDLQKYVDDNKQQLKTTLDKLTQELKGGRASEDYTEIDLKTWIEQLKEIRKILENPSTISITDDNDEQSTIHLIQVKQIQTTNDTIKPSITKLDDETYHLQYQRENIQHDTKHSTQTAMMTNITEKATDRSSSVTKCKKCNRMFSIHNNQGGNCIHEGTWHAKLEDCSFFKCGFNLGLKASIGSQHWSCCYSLEHGGNRCSESGPHIAASRED